jgi:HK97 gp10 family phage protein
METVTVHGLKELRDALTRKIPLEMQAKVLQQALTAGTKMTVAAARALAPRDTGRMKKAIYAARDKRGSKLTYEQRVVTVRRGKKRDDPRGAYYWKFVEFGHKTAKGHVAPNPFIRPAFETTKLSAVDAIKDKLKLAIEKAAAKARF